MLVASEFAVRLRKLRADAGMSQYALAKASGVSKQAVSQLESGDSEPTWATVQKLARALGVSVADFDDEDGGRMPPVKRKPKK